MFRGVTNLNLDAKGRMAMPSRYRDRLLECCGGQLVVTVDRDGCLLIYPLPEWERVEQDVADLPSMQKGVKEFKRLLLGYATELDLDAQGRILLPAPLRDVAKLDRHAVLAGQGNKFELWNEEAWIAQRDAWLAGSGDHDSQGDVLGSVSI